MPGPLGPLHPPWLIEPVGLGEMLLRQWVGQLLGGEGAAGDKMQQQEAQTAGRKRGKRDDCQPPNYPSGKPP